MKNLIFLFLLITLGCLGQNASQGSLSNIPQESIYVHQNASLLFAGERLNYKVYCLDNSSRTLSSISKIAYVSLVANNGKTVFTHKIRLQNGEGYGDYFVPTSVATGSYKLLAYSEWMKNGRISDFFQSDFKIINPYQPIPKPYLEEEMSTDSMVTLPAIASQQKTLSSQKLVSTNSSFVDISFEKSVLGKRNKVELKISGLDESAKNGTYSLSIRHTGNIGGIKNKTLNDFYTDFLQKGPKNQSQPTKVNYLPEIRGEIISGNVIGRDENTDQEGKKVSLSILGKDYLFLVSTTDSIGRFYFNVNRAYDNTSAIIQVLGDDWDAYTIELDDRATYFDQLTFVDFKISQNLKEDILKKSIHNQIENAFISVRSDSIIPAKHTVPFYRNLKNVYVLDDYTRFNSISETIIEVVNQVSIKRLNDEKRIFQVRPPEGFTENNVPPMVFVDGLFLKEHQDFMDYSAKKIKSISFSEDKYLLGSEVFQGIISFETINNDFIDEFYAPYLKKIDLFRPEPQKKYFVQKYDSRGQSERVPDFRYQLLWMPELSLGSDTEVDFYTSDIPGDYEIVLEGLTKDGKPVSIKNWIKVE